MLEMFQTNLLTGPLFLAGVFNGMNRRAEPNFQHDSRAHYKLMGTTVGFGSLMGIQSYFQEHHPSMKSRFSAHLVGGGIAGFLASGTAYCMGLMLTKIPSKKAFE